MDFWPCEHDLTLKQEEKGGFDGFVCEVCGSREFLAGLAKSAYASLNYPICVICLGNLAEPLWLVQEAIKLAGGIENLDDRALVSFDPAMDSYIDLRTGRPFKIRTVEGTEYLFKNDLMNVWRDNIPKPNED